MWQTKPHLKLTGRIFVVYLEEHVTTRQNFFPLPKVGCVEKSQVFPKCMCTWWPGYRSQTPNGKKM
jgi:hypothetical protein